MLDEFCNNSISVFISKIIPQTASKQFPIPRRYRWMSLRRAAIGSKEE
jgi:hypothetical protein